MSSLLFLVILSYTMHSPCTVERLLNVRQFGSDPFIVLVLSLSFIASIFFLHISAKIIRAFTK